MRQPGKRANRAAGSVLCCGPKPRPWAVRVRTTTGTGRAPAVDVSRLGDVVEELVCRLEGEVGEHQLDDRPEPGDRRAERKPAEAVLGDWGAEDAVGGDRERVLRRSVRASAEVADLLAEHERARLSLEGPGEGAGDRGGELHRLHLAARLERLRGLDARRIRRDPRERRRPRRRGSAAARGGSHATPSRSTVHQFGGSGHQVGRQGSNLLDLHRGETAFIEVAGERSEWVASPPLRLLVLRAVPVGASGKLPVLMAVAIRLGLDQHRSVPGGCVAARLTNGLPHCERVHPVDDEPEHVLAGGAKHDVGEADGLLDGCGDGVEVVLDDEDRGKPQTRAMLIPSWKAPIEAAPSPRKATATRRVGEAAGVGEP